MPEPLVCCVMLTNDSRPELTQRAIRGFHRFTYANKRLLLFDSATVNRQHNWEVAPGSNCTLAQFPQCAEWSIGRLRNAAIALTKGWADIIVHMDDDDLSAPTRLSEQVALLQSSGAAVVGYNEVLFWREPNTRMRHGGLNDVMSPSTGEAWLFKDPPHHAPGTSYCYWMRTWTSTPFPDLMVGEDNQWLRMVGWQQVHSVSSIVDGEPRIVASLHGGNKCSQIIPNAPEWKRVSEWDATVRRMVEEA